MVFEPFGPVELVQLPLDLETGQCKSYGFIQFAQVEHAKAAQSLNGKLDIAGRVIKVSAVTDHFGVQETGTDAADFDDDDGGGLSLNARSRALLMQKLDCTGTASSIAESLGVPLLNGAIPTQQPLSLPLNGQAAVPLMSPTLVTSSLTAPVMEPTECILLTNMFDPSTETEPDFDLDIKEDVEEECSKFGPVKHIYMDTYSSGHVYLKFATVAAEASCRQAMDKRFFAQRCISATFMLKLLTHRVTIKMREERLVERREDRKKMETMLSFASHVGIPPHRVSSFEPFDDDDDDDDASTCIGDDRAPSH